LITAAGRALATGDAIGALKRVGLRNDPPALALRGIAMAQLGDLPRAKELLKRAARAFGSKEAVAKARCVVAEAEIALAMRDLDWKEKELDAARRTLAEHGDRVNAAHARLLVLRRLVLIGRIGEAERLLADLAPEPLPPASRTVYELIVAGIAMRRLKTKPARAALLRAERAARYTGISALAAEVATARAILDAPAARSIQQGDERVLRLEDVEALMASNALIVDACRYVVRDGRKTISLASRPVLLALARALGETSPEDVARDELIARAFRSKIADESHRARLRVEMARLRSVLRPVADIHATPRGFVLRPREVREVVVLARPVEEKHAAILAFLVDGEAWSSSALALALGASQRSVQRSLDALAAGGKAQSFGRGRTRRWTAPPMPGFATILLLPGPLPVD
jgi:hypothetical protein